MSFFVRQQCGMHHRASNQLVPDFHDNPLRHIVVMKISINSTNILRTAFVLTICWIVSMCKYNTDCLSINAQNKTRFLTSQEDQIKRSGCIESFWQRYRQNLVG